MSLLIGLLIGYWVIWAICYMIFHPIKTIETIFNGIGFLFLLAVIFAACA